MKTWAEQCEWPEVNQYKETVIKAEWGGANRSDCEFTTTDSCGADKKCTRFTLAQGGYEEDDSST